MCLIKNNHIKIAWSILQITSLKDFIVRNKVSIVPKIERISKIRYILVGILTIKKMPT